MSVEFPKLSFVLGGAASGKSDFAEALAISAGRDLVYIATAQGLDDDMQAKIDKHKASRGSNWTTIEEPLEIAHTLRHADPQAVVLIDCLSLWLSNLMHADRDVSHHTEMLLDAIDHASCAVICVSNEVGMSLVAPTKLGRDFQNAQGAMNRAVAAHANLAVLVSAGLPVVLKGTLP